MVRGKMSVQEKRDIARRQIMDVSLELFLKKGFEETTTRDIIAKAGILNGSLYNRFKNKDEILISILKDAIADIMRESEEIFRNSKNFLAALSFPGIFQLYVASRSVRIAKLIYVVHCRWEAVNIFIDIFGEWWTQFVKEFNFASTDSDRSRMILSSFIGSIGNMVGFYANGGNADYKEASKHHVLTIATTLGVPVVNLSETLDIVFNLLESGELVFLGHKLSEGLTE